MTPCLLSCVLWFPWVYCPVEYSTRGCCTTWGKPSATKEDTMPGYFGVRNEDADLDIHSPRLSKSEIGTERGHSSANSCFHCSLFLYFAASMLTGRSSVCSAPEDAVGPLSWSHPCWVKCPSSEGIFLVLLLC